MNRKERKWKNYGENMIKKAFCSFILIALICCSVCSCASDPVNAVQEEFAKFKTMNSVALVGENELVTKNLRINLEETLGIPDHNMIRGLSISNNYLYAITERSSDGLEISIYKVDLGTKARTLMVQRDVSADRVEINVKNGFFLINVTRGELTQTDAYSVAGGEYIENASAETLANLQSERYACRIQNGDSFLVEDLASGESRVIDASYLESTWYGGALSALSARPHSAEVRNGRIVLIYRSNHWSQALFGGNDMICFVYDFEGDDIAFDSILKPSDDGEVQILYNIKSAQQNYNYKYYRLKKNKSPQLDGAINYYLFYREEGGTTVPAIKIYDSYRFRDSEEQREIIKTIIASDNGEHGFSEEDIDFYLLEWKFHNFAYDHPNSVSAVLDMPYEKVVKSSKDVDLNTNDKHRDVYEQWADAVWQ